MRGENIDIIVLLMVNFNGLRGMKRYTLEVKKYMNVYFMGVLFLKVYDNVDMNLKDYL